MKNAFLFSLGALLYLGSHAADATVSDEDQAWDFLFKGAQTPDYARHEKFLAALGFDFSDPLVTIVKEQGKENPKVLGRKQDVKIRPNRKTALSASIKDAEYSSFVPVGKNIALVSLFFGLETTSLCLREAGFEKTFAPVEHIYATDEGGEHPERTFLGKQKRQVAALLDGNGCAIKIYLNQSS